MSGNNNNNGSSSSGNNKGSGTGTGGKGNKKSHPEPLKSNPPNKFAYPGGSKRKVVIGNHPKKSGDSSKK
ncbi:hypothetical protein PMZ80_007582 [Knufia obscura]|uniref:Uncharacterized protein n=2 Tax=Knufia TaxID=430999 RepID=A0AAN8I9C0_9EURO|nr:hypothetical protein PMZ80_007582 [Knufia obscura]KAK5954125.1 hypothetical protein OHC33_004697 [Knufia fluminis]